MLPRWPEEAARIQSAPAGFNGGGGGGAGRSGRSSVVSSRVILGCSLGNSNFLLVVSLGDITPESLD